MWYHPRIMTRRAPACAPDSISSVYLEDYIHSILGVRTEQIFDTMQDCLTLFGVMVDGVF
jgi:hypothetical protein